MNPATDDETPMNGRPARPFQAGAAVAAISLVLATHATEAVAQSRHVFVNGQRMTDPQVQVLAQRACTPIPDGAYWLNMRTGEWGYVGNPRVQGRLGDQCRQQAGGGGGVVRKGPFVSWDRANIEARAYRARGSRVGDPFHSGDGYYIDVQP